MGKLHTLRRAILRDPEKWKKARSAWHYNNGWTPSQWFWNKGPYYNFIKKVLSK